MMTELMVSEAFVREHYTPRWKFTKKVAESQGYLFALIQIERLTRADERYTRIHEIARDALREAR